METWPLVRDAIRSRWQGPTQLVALTLLNLTVPYTLAQPSSPTAWATTAVLTRRSRCDRADVLRAMVELLASGCVRRLSQRPSAPFYCWDFAKL